MAMYNSGYQYLPGPSPAAMDPYRQQMLNNHLQQINMQPQIQNSGFILAPNEEYAFNYPVAPGNSVSFKDENKPYVYVKTMGLSQFDQPTFERYRLVKEEDPVATPQPAGEYALKSDLDAIRADIETIKKSLHESE